MTRISWIAIVWLTMFSSVADCAELSGPERVVEQYCKADMAGANLSSENYRKSGLKFIVLPLEGMGPAWDKVVLVKKFKILPSQPIAPHAHSSHVTVEYSVLGQMDSGLTLNIDKHVETYVFDLKRSHGKWKVLEPIRDLPPHISVETAIKDLKSQMSADSENRSAYQGLISKLEKFRGD